ncbi:MAG: NAD-dependent epimerase/dehydratase family protein [Desulfobulbaceae bacterium]|nr:NAD-dependent epimerase/dehydratase family protein [Desulfofustis sp.]RZW27196.1 MAG: NAD-dependent epimerase/dehydratase family protein [Desulfobulbaceae bacterium]
MKVLVLGGTGVISREIVKLLIAEQHEVTLYNRGSRDLQFTDGIRLMSGNRLARNKFESVMQNERFDAVIDMICFNEADARSTVAAFADSGAHIVICSSVAVYKRPYKSVPTVESAEELFDDPTFPYAFDKAEVERYLNRVIAERKLPLSMIRPSLTFGPGAANMGVLRQNYGIIDRIRKGKPLVMFGDGSTVFSFTFTADLAKAFVGILGDEKTFGEAYHVCSEERSRWEDLYLAFGRVLESEVEIVHIPSELLAAANPDLFSHLYFEKTYPGLFDNSKIRGVLPDFRCEIDLNEGVRMMVEWFEKEANQVDQEKDALEDRLVELHAGWKTQMKELVK